MASSAWDLPDNQQLDMFSAHSVNADGDSPDAGMVAVRQQNIQYVLQMHPQRPVDLPQPQDLPLTYFPQSGFDMPATRDDNLHGDGAHPTVRSEGNMLTGEGFIIGDRPEFPPNLFQLPTPVQTPARPSPSQVTVPQTPIPDPLCQECGATAVSPK